MVLKHIKVPNLGESVTEATILEWLVKPGDEVKRYQPILEAQSDKVVTEIPSEFDGVVKEILVEADETVVIGTKILTIETEGEEGETEKVEETPEPKEETKEKQEKKEAKQQVKPKAPKDSSAPRFSPAVVRIAQERGINLDDVTGTGKHGRITRKDILAFDPEDVVAEEPVQEQVVEESPKAEKVEKVEQTPIEKQVAQAAGDTVIPADGIRKSIASKMVQSKTEIPHAWMMVEADVTNIVNLRNEVKDDFKSQEGVSLSFFPFFVKAVAHALKKNPLLNSSWDDGNIVLHKDINLSIAVATEDHLFVPVIKNADDYSITGVAKEVNRLAAKARDGQLSGADMANGTFTVNNTGALGSVQSMGIINHPQAAILQVESIQEKLVPTKNGFETASMVNLCLSIDHRILDGLQAGKFLQDVKENLAFYNEEASIY